MSRRLNWAWLSVIVLCLTGSPAAADREAVVARCTGHSGASAQVRAITASEVLELTDGTKVRVALMHWDGGETGDDALRALLADEPVILFPAALRDEPDRYGRYVRHVVRRRDGLWLQEAILLTGHARLQPSPLARFCVTELADAEQQARQTQAGLWARAANRMKQADDPKLIAFADSVQMVAGTVLSVGRTRRNVYLNFGTDWTLDFTAVIPVRILEDDDPERFDLAELKGKRVILRGWIERHNGPQMRIAVPEQIEILE